VGTSPPAEKPRPRKPRLVNATPHDLCPWNGQIILAGEDRLRRCRPGVQFLLGQHRDVPDDLLYGRVRHLRGGRGFHAVGDQDCERLHRPYDRRPGRSHPHALREVPSLPDLDGATLGGGRGADLHDAGPGQGREAHLGIRHVLLSDGQLHRDQYPLQRPVGRVVERAPGAHDD